MISDLTVKDSFTTYCAVIFTPAKDKGATRRKIFRPTDGLVKMHAGERIHFENLAAYGGGIAFRLETGAGGLNGGILISPQKISIVKMGLLLC